jgi:hypothetical protein
MSPAVTCGVQRRGSWHYVQRRHPCLLEVARKTLAKELALERRATPSQQVMKLELEMYRKDGSTIWTEMNRRFLRCRRSTDRDPGSHPPSASATVEQALEEAKTLSLIAETPQT